MLIAGYAWTAANFWRGLFGRVSEVAGGGVLDYGWAELCFTACILIAALAGLVWALVLNTTPSGQQCDRVFLILSVCQSPRSFRSSFDVVLRSATHASIFALGNAVTCALP